VKPVERPTALVKKREMAGLKTRGAPWVEQFPAERLINILIYVTTS
jgi:hypothetical protein